MPVYEMSAYRLHPVTGRLVRRAPVTAADVADRPPPLIPHQPEHLADVPCRHDDANEDPSGAVTDDTEGPCRSQPLVPSRAQDRELIADLERCHISVHVRQVGQEIAARVVLARRLEAPDADTPPVGPV